MKQLLSVPAVTKGWADEVPSQLDWPQDAFDKYAKGGAYWFVALVTIDDDDLQALLDGKAFHMEAGDGAVIVTLDRAVEVHHE